MSKADAGNPSEQRTSTMSTITTTDGVEIFYKDWGKGQPIVFSHGWPLSADDWDAQMMFFLGHGLSIFVRSWRPNGGARAIVVICHGFNAHSGQYQSIGEQFAAV